MANLSLKNIPDQLYEQLKRQAAANRRSLNKEAIWCLEHAVRHPRADTAAFLEDIRTLREQGPRSFLTDDFLDRAKREGRS